MGQTSDFASMGRYSGKFSAPDGEKSTKRRHSHSTNVASAKPHVADALPLAGRLVGRARILATQIVGFALNARRLRVFPNAEQYTPVPKCVGNVPNPLNGSTVSSADRFIFSSPSAFAPLSARVARPSIIISDFAVLDLRTNRPYSTSTGGTFGRLVCY